MLESSGTNYARRLNPKVTVPKPISQFYFLGTNLRLRDCARLSRLPIAPSCIPAASASAMADWVTDESKYVQ